MPPIDDDGQGGVRVAVKVVPGASRNEIAGVLGDRVKIRVAAAPEDGKANRAVCALIAKAVGVKKSAVTVLSGASAAEKVIGIAGVAAERVREGLRVE